jgi:hypothetical protein
VLDAGGLADRLHDAFLQVAVDVPAERGGGGLEDRRGGALHDDERADRDEQPDAARAVSGADGVGDAADQQAGEDCGADRDERLDEEAGDHDRCARTAQLGKQAEDGQQTLNRRREPAVDVKSRGHDVTMTPIPTSPQPSAATF